MNLRATCLPIRCRVQRIDMSGSPPLRAGLVTDAKVRPGVDGPNDR